MQALEEFPLMHIQDFSSNGATDMTVLSHRAHGIDDISKPHRHNFLMFFLVEQGHGMHEIDFESHSLDKQQIHILLPGQVHYWQLSPDTQGYQLMLSKEALDIFAGGFHFNWVLYLESPVILLNSPEFKNFKYEFQQLYLELKAAHKDLSVLYARCKLIVQLIKRSLEQRYADFIKSHEHPLIMAYGDLIDQQFKSVHAVSEYANQLHISANYLNVLCQKYLGLSAGTLIHNRVVLEAKRMLQLNKGIKQIAYSLGFNDLAYFSNFFKHKTGMAPRHFKQLL